MIRGVLFGRSPLNFGHTISVKYCVKRRIYFMIFNTPKKKEKLSILWQFFFHIKNKAKKRKKDICIIEEILPRKIYRMWEWRQLLRKLLICYELAVFMFVLIKQTRIRKRNYERGFKFGVRKRNDWRISSWNAWIH